MCVAYSFITVDRKGRTLLSLFDFCVLGSAAMSLPLRSDGDFAQEVLEHINGKINESKEEYGASTESRSGIQVKQLCTKYGIIIEGVSDREYVSNSFHSHVTEDITPIQ